MKAIADIHIIPLGVGTSLSTYIAACEKVIRDAGLNPNLHAYGTNVEGDWDAVTGALKKCHEVLHEMGAPRVSSALKIGTRTDREESIQTRVDSVQAKG